MTRRICIRYDKGGKFYKQVLDNFMTIDYHNPIKGYGMLYPTDLITYHYAWIRPNKFRELRCDQLQRSGTYWDDFCRGLDEADQYESSEIVVRPKVADDDLRKHIKFFDKFEHPKHIKQHECWVELSDDVRDRLRN